MIFELPSSLEKCSDLKELIWISENGSGKLSIDDYELIGLGKEGFKFADCDNCVVCKQPVVTTKKTTTTKTTTTATTTKAPTTTTSATTQPPTTTKKKVEKRPCEDVFKGKDGNPRKEVTIRMDVDVNTLLSVNVGKLLAKADLLENSRSKNFAIKDVTPSKIPHFKSIFTYIYNFYPYIFSIDSCIELREC